MLPSLPPDSFFSIFFSRCSLKRFPLNWYFLLEKTPHYTLSCITTTTNKAKQFYCFCSCKSMSSTSWIFDKQLMKRKKKTLWNFLPCFLESHSFQEVLEVQPDGDWEEDQHLPKLHFHSRAPTRGKGCDTAGVVKGYSSQSGWDWLRNWWLWKQKQTSASEQMPLTDWQLNPGEDQALTDLSVRPDLHTYLWLLFSTLRKNTNTLSMCTVFPKSQSSCRILNAWMLVPQGASHPGRKGGGSLFWGVSPKAIAEMCNSHCLLAKHCFHLRSCNQPHWCTEFCPCFPW